jgi:hypothetical protein
VKTSRFIALIAIPLLFACAPKKPEIPLTEVPAGPLLHALEQRQRSFAGLKAIASIEVVKRGRKRTLENVGIVLDSQRRLRMEAFGPLGESLLAFVWDGREMALRLPENDRVVRQGPEGLERLLGEGLEVQELCALLSGNLPISAWSSDARLFCGQGGECMLELSYGDTVRRVGVIVSAGSEQRSRFISHELHRSGTLVYRVRFDRVEKVSQYPLPMKITIENPDAKLRFTVEYLEAGVNVPIRDEAFLLKDAGAETP